jgi:hypothetical protein
MIFCHSTLSIVWHADSWSEELIERKVLDAGAFPASSLPRYLKTEESSLNSPPSMRQNLDIKRIIVIFIYKNTFLRYLTTNQSKEEVIMKKTIKDYTNPMYIYCRMRDLRLPKRKALALARAYEKFVSRVFYDVQMR